MNYFRFITFKFNVPTCHSGKASAPLVFVLIKTLIATGFETVSEASYRAKCYRNFATQFGRDY